MGSGFECTLSETSFFDLFCFVCGESISDLGINLLDAKTSYMGLSLPDKLGHVIGNKYLIVVSKEDKVCGRCHNLINHLEELEYNLSVAKQRVIKLLEFTHKLNSLVDKDLSDYQVLNDPVIHSSEFKIIDVKNTCNITKSESLLTPCTNSNIFSSENSILNEFDNGVTTIQVKKRMSNENSTPVLTLCQDSVAPNSICEAYVLDQIICENEKDMSLSLKEDPSIKNINPPIEHIQEEFKGGNSQLSDIISFNVRAAQEIERKSSQVLLSISDVNKSCGSEQKNKNSDNMSSSTCNQFKENEQSNIVKEKVFICSICDIPFPKPYLLSRHTRIHKRNSEKVQCQFCNLECHDHLHYLYHRKNEHDILKRLSCSLCNKHFLSNKELKNHILTAHEGEKFSCDSCGETFKRLIQFENHKLYFHGNRNCRICGKHISSAVKLRQHENRHALVDIPKLSCDVCGRTFKTPGGLRVHKVSHTGNYKYFCEFCGRGFMSQVILEEHKGVHTKEERYVCDICGRKFVLYSTFHLHKQWHKDPFPFPCHICKKKFRYRSVRSTHMKRDHTGENPHKCHYCDAEFLRYVTLKRHISIHTQKYPFICHLCPKGFDLRRSLARHMARIHNDRSLLNEEPKQCQYKVILRPEEFPTNEAI